MLYIGNQSVAPNVLTQGGVVDQQQADWNQSDTNAVDYIKNKPTIPSVDQVYNGSSANAQSGVAIASAGFLTSHQDISGKANVGDCYTKQESDAKYLTSHQDISGKQDTSNLVTSLSASSTDTQYPSAKCVYDILGDIETLLQGV